MIPVFLYKQLICDADKTIDVGNIASTDGNYLTKK